METCAIFAFFNDSIPPQWHFHLLVETMRAITFSIYVFIAILCAQSEAFLSSKVRYSSTSANFVRHSFCAHALNNNDEIKDLSLEKMSGVFEKADKPLLAQPTSTPILQRFAEASEFSKTLWDFSRPHTIVGSGLSVIAIFLFATPPDLWFTPLFRSSLLSTLAPSLLMNLYITGLNQLTDIEIDKINKPYLPLASGSLRRSHGIAAVVASLLAALAFAFKSASWPLQLTLLGSCFLGTIYSLPPFRLKRFPLLAAFCILVVRGSLVNIGFFLRAKQMIEGSNSILSRGLLASCTAFPECTALAAFFAIFGVVIAIMKDVPDIAGDRAFSIASFSVRLGPRKTFDFSVNLLLALLGGSAVGSIGSVLALVRNGGIGAIVSGVGLKTASTAASLACNGIPSTNIRIGARLSLGALFGLMATHAYRKSRTVDPESSKGVFEYYMYLWKVFYWCYAVLPIAATAI